MKQQIRHQIKEKIKNILQTKKQEYSFLICQKIIEKFGHLDTRHIYEAMPDEINTQPLINRLKANSKKVYFAPQNT